jgi:hypothetical protein
MHSAVNHALRRFGVHSFQLFAVREIAEFRHWNGAPYIGIRWEPGITFRDVRQRAFDFALTHPIAYVWVHDVPGAV